MNISTYASIGAACAALVSGAVIAADPAPDAKVLARGKYVVQTSGCNDCHTDNYPQADGKVPEAAWLTGSVVGFQGPWGTTYPANLRLTMQKLTEQQWMAQARSPRRPPMPWFNLRDMNDADLKAMYHYVRSLGPKGEPAPAFVPPGQAVTTPFIVFVPQSPPAPAAKRP